MIIDNLLRVSNEQAVTASAVSTDKVDLSIARDIGAGEELYMHFLVTEAALAVGSATVEFQVVGATDASITSPIVLGSSGPIGKAELIVGKRIAVRINPMIDSNAYRYLGAYYSVATGPLTAGKFTADIVKDVQDAKKYYASGYSVL